MGRRDDDDERERPSWREIDQRRDHPEEYQRNKPGSGSKKEERSTASYKAQLSKAFDQGDILQKVEQRRSGRKGAAVEEPEGEETSRARLVRRLRQAPDARQRIEALDALLAAQEKLPDDAALLATLIDHPQEQVVTGVLLQLLPLLELQPLKHKASFVMRLETLKMTAERTETLEAVDRVLEQLGR